MTDEEALRLVDAVLKRAAFGSLQEFVFRQVWNGQSYMEIASSGGYSPEYIKRVGARLWRSLSDALGKKVTKSNVHSILRRYVAQAQAAQEPKATSEALTIDQDSKHPKSPLSYCNVFAHVRRTYESGGGSGI